MQVSWRGKTRLSHCLRKLLRSLERTVQLKKKLSIRHARILILKLTTEDDIDVDISIGNDGGPKAADFAKKVRQLPALRPLCWL